MRALYLEAMEDGGIGMSIGDLSEDIQERVKQLQTFVGGYIESVDLRDGTMYVNEEGKLLGLPSNEFATVMAHDRRAISLRNDWISGNAVVVGPPDEDGDDTDLPSILERQFYALAGIRAPIDGQASTEP